MPKVTREKDRGNKKLRAALRRANNATLKVGHFDRPHKGSDVNMATLASIHALGAPSRNIPRRDWIAPVIDGRRRLHDIIRRRLVGEALDGKRSMESALFEFGQIVVGDLKLSMTRIRSPKLKPATIKAKGSSNPLIDLGFLRNGHEARLFIGGARIR